MEYQTSQDSISGGGEVGCLFHEVCSVSNIYRAWKKFRQGKTKKFDIQEFEFNLEENIFKIHRSLISKTYRPKPYQSFFVTDPKLRHIHKAEVFDRVVHQALFQKLYPIVERKLSTSVYSAREQKGIHKAVKKLYQTLQKETCNWKRQVWVLKYDIRKFFDSIDHKILIEKIKRYSFDPDTIGIIELLVYSFEKTKGKGLPLGNVTSQLFANTYLNDFDWFIKKDLNIKYYFRYCDDFIILLQNRDSARKLLSCIQKELGTIALVLHPQKVSVRKVTQGIDFLGYVILPHSVILRSNTKKRIYKRLERQNSKGIIESYLGVATYAKGRALVERLLSEKSVVDKSLPE